MSRRTVTLAVGGFLAIVLVSVAAMLPVPYVALNPGPTSDTLGAVDGTKLIRIEGRRTYPHTGHLDLTTVSVLGGPRRRLDLVTALRGWLDDRVAVIPEEQVYPDGETAEEAERAGAAEMRDSQENATTAALRHLGIPVTTRILVNRVMPGAPAEGVLKAGDRLVKVDDRRVSGGAELRELITAHEPGEPVDLVVRRAGRRIAVTITTAEADGHAIIGIETRDDADYPFSVEISIKDVGGPSAGLMFALGIVDLLEPGSLTGGAHVAGTGSIDDDGAVGQIGGITQKMIGARRVGATIFLAPAGNCAEAAATVPDGMRLVKVTTLESAVAALDTLSAGGTEVPSCRS